MRRQLPITKLALAAATPTAPAAACALAALALALPACTAAETEEATGEPLPPPTYWSAEATKAVDDLVFVDVDGKHFFAIGFDAHWGPVWDGEAGEGECDEATGKGWLDINVDKTHGAAEAGANFAYVWSYGKHGDTLVATTPRLHGIFHGGYGIDRPVEDDVIPIVYNGYGEVDLDGYDAARADEMRADFADFVAREGAFSPEAMPNLPPIEQVGHLSWHPTFRMRGRGTGEELSPEEATDLATATNMMIGDNYTYVENRFDMNDYTEKTIGLIMGQKGDKGEGYDDWIATNDPDHQSMFDAGWGLASSLTSKRTPGSVVWLWMQGYSFGDSIAEQACRGEESDSWATGGFPSDAYLRKEIASTIAAGGTGIVFFGFFMNRWPETERLYAFMRALASDEVYEPVLTSPRLDLGVDTSAMGEGGRSHVLAKWHEASKRAFLVVANPGALATPLTVEMPWTVDEVEVLDWSVPAFVADPAASSWDKRVSMTVPRDEGVILRVTPKRAPDAAP